jgi:hypothetical protein
LSSALPFFGSLCSSTTPWVKFNYD